MTDKEDARVPNHLRTRDKKKFDLALRFGQEAPDSYDISPVLEGGAEASIEDGASRSAKRVANKDGWLSPRHDRTEARRQAAAAGLRRRGRFQRRFDSSRPWNARARHLRGAGGRRRFSGELTGCGRLIARGGNHAPVRAFAKIPRFSVTSPSARRSTAPMHRFSSQKTGPSRPVRGSGWITRKRTTSGSAAGRRSRTSCARELHPGRHFGESGMWARHSTRVWSARFGFALFNSHRWAINKRLAWKRRSSPRNGTMGADVGMPRNAAFRRKFCRYAWFSCAPRASSSITMHRAAFGATFENVELPKGVTLTPAYRRAATYTDRRRT